MPPKSNSRARSGTGTRVGGDGEPSGESLNQVRDILFGGQIRSMESRLNRMEERFQEELDGSQADVASRLESLEQTIKREVQALADKLTGERAKRTEEFRSLNAELKRSIKDLDKRVADLDRATTTADADLRDQILKQAGNVAGDLQRISEETTAALEKEMHILRAEKADTASIVALFSDMAVRLTEELSDSTQK